MIARTRFPIVVFSSPKFGHRVSPTPAFSVLVKWSNRFGMREELFKWGYRAALEKVKSEISSETFHPPNFIHEVLPYMYMMLLFNILLLAALEILTSVQANSDVTSIVVRLPSCSVSGNLISEIHRLLTKSSVILLERHFRWWMPDKQRSTTMSVYE